MGKMSRMVLLYILALSMVSLPTSLARHLLVKTAANQRGDDYTDFKPKPEPGPPPISSDYSLGIWTERDKALNKLEEKMIERWKKEGEDYRKKRRKPRRRKKKGRRKPRRRSGHSSMEERHFSEVFQIPIG